MIRRFVVPLLIACLFVIGSYYAVSPLAAQLYAERAAELSKGQKPLDAIGSFETAIRLDGLNARYYDQIGRICLMEGKASRKVSLLARARNAYTRAIKLNSVSARYRLGWAEAEAALLLQQGAVSDEEIGTYIDTLKKAIELAPNDYYINAAAGYYILLFRDRISRKDRNYANGLEDFDILYKITPQAPEWQRALRNFLRDIDKWKYRR
jgi:tetratricopeptide (TPR) repeat protein